MDELADYGGEPTEEIIHRSVPYGTPDEPLVFLMGPYRLLDPAYLFSDGDYRLPPDPLAPGDDTVPSDSIADTLREVAKRVSEETPTTVFIASDVEIPTVQEANERELAEPGLSVIEQSLAFASASAGNVFVFTKAGLTTGVGAEAGALPEYFDLRDESSSRRDPRTLCILAEGELVGEGEQRHYEPKFGSASISEMDRTYGIQYRHFADKSDLADAIISFIESYVMPLRQ